MERYTNTFAHYILQLFFDNLSEKFGHYKLHRHLFFQAYNLGLPGLSKNVDIGCSRGLATAYSFGIDTNFIVAILVCIAILLRKFAITNSNT